MAKAKKEELSLGELLEHALVKVEEQPYEVLNNWVWTRLGDIIKVSSGKSLTAKKMVVDGGIPVYGGNGVTGYHNDFNINKPTIVIGRVGFYCGSIHFINEKAWVTDNALIVNFLEGKIDIKFLYWLLSNTNLRENDSSTAQPVISGSKIYALSIPLPPLAEQQRIVERIESLFEKLDTAKELAQNALDSFENRKAAILHKAFTGELTAKWREENKNVESAEQYLQELNDKRIKENKKAGFKFWDDDNYPRSWKITTIGGFIYMAGRIGWKGLKAEEYTQEGPILLAVYNLNYGDYVDLNNVYHISEERYEESPEIQLENDDILLAKDGAGIGKIGYIRDLTTKATVNSSLLVIKPRDSVHAKFLFRFLEGPQMQQIVKSRITGSATPHLFQRDIKEFVIPIPPMEEQREIARILDEVLEKQQQAQELCDVIDKIDLMKKAILARAFRGELGTNNPEEESAIELLKEVLQEKL